LLTIGSASTAIWTIFICLFTFFWIQFGQQRCGKGILGKPGKIFEIVALTISYGAPIAFAFSGFLIQHRGYSFYNPAGEWCWIDIQYNDYRFFFVYLWVFVAMFSLIIFYGLLIWKVRQISDPRYKRVISAMYGYPLVFFILFAPQSSVRVWEFFSKRVPPSWLIEIASVLWSLSGVGNFIVYGVTRGIFTPKVYYLAIDLILTIPETGAIFCGKCTTPKFFSIVFGKNLIHNLVKLQFSNFQSVGELDSIQ
jgi:hypothetical protein